MKVLFLYHSGVGNTKLVTDLIRTHVEKHLDTALYAIEATPENIDIDAYAALVIGFPTYHSYPSPDIMSYLENIRPMRVNKPAFIFTTCGWYSANALRVFSKLSLTRNITPMMSRTYRCIATDGMLLAPSLRFLFDFDTNLTHKIRYDTSEFMIRLRQRNFEINMPRFKLYSIVNYPNAFLGKRHTMNIHLLEDRCIQCGRCVANCNMSAYTINSHGYPVFDKSKCVNCYRCIHHCPKHALTIRKHQSPRVLLDAEFYKMKLDEYANLSS